MKLDLSPLRLAIERVEESLHYARSDLALGDIRLAHQFRAAAIQAFEFTYELSYKMLVRFLRETEPVDMAMESMSFQQIIRLGYQRGLLHAELREWLEFRKKRGTTSHTYDGEKAQDVFIAIPDFLSEAKALLVEIEERQSRA